jgi:hypothetical protein
MLSLGGPPQPPRDADDGPVAMDADSACVPCRGLQPWVPARTFPSGLHWPPRRPKALVVPPAQPLQQKPNAMSAPTPPGGGGGCSAAAPAAAGEWSEWHQPRQQQACQQQQQQQQQQERGRRCPERAPTPTARTPRRHTPGLHANSSSAPAQAAPVTRSPDVAVAAGKVDLRKATLLRSLLQRTEELLRLASPRSSTRAGSGSPSAVAPAGAHAAAAPISPALCWATAPAAQLPQPCLSSWDPHQPSSSGRVEALLPSRHASSPRSPDALPRDTLERLRAKAMSAASTGAGGHRGGVGPPPGSSRVGSGAKGHNSLSQESGLSNGR